jgi:hypothetical protein
MPLHTITYGTDLIVYYSVDLISFELDVALVS